LLLCILIAGMAAGFLPPRGFRDLLRRPFKTEGNIPSLQLFVFALIAMAVFANLSGAFTPPWAYDDLEYHLAVPAQFYREGGIRFLPHNVYSNFPENVEMWYLFSMSLLRSPIAGAYVGKALNFLLGIATLLALRAASRRFFGAAAGDFAAAFFYISPLVTTMSSVAHVEMALMFYATGAIYCFLVMLDTGELKWAVLCGAMVGLACGCKLTAVILLLVPLVLAAVLLKVSRGSSALSWKCAVLLPVVAIATLFPWLIKNYAFTGNPVFPFLYSLFGGKAWTGWSSAMWRSAHFPSDFSLSAFVATAREALFNSKLITLPMFLFIPLVLLRRPRPCVVAVLIYSLVAFLMWFALTHRDDRFLAPLVPAMCLLSAGECAAASSRLLKAAVAALLLFCIVQVGVNAVAMGNFDAFIYPRENERFFRDNTDFYEGYLACKFINERLPRDAVVLFVGEARTFYCERGFVAPVVFNRHPLLEMLSSSGDDEEVSQWLRESSITHLLINWRELRRLRRTYGAYPNLDEGRLARFLASNLTRIASFGEADEGGRPPVELYRVPW